jgi:hypothetical protein
MEWFDGFIASKFDSFLVRFSICAFVTPFRFVLDPIGGSVVGSLGLGGDFGRTSRPHSPMRDRPHSSIERCDEDADFRLLSFS